MVKMVPPAKWLPGSFELRLAAVTVVVALTHILVISIDLADDGRLAASTLLLALVLPPVLFALQSLLLVHEVRRRRRAESRAIKEAEELKTAILATVSHELRTPLAAIKAAVTGLLDDRVRGEPGAEGELLGTVDLEPIASPN